MNHLALLQQRFTGCMLAGAIGDAWGSAFEHQVVPNDKVAYYWGQAPSPTHQWVLTDDTQLTMATCETLSLPGQFDPTLLASSFVRYYREKKLIGLGSSTLKAIIDLQEGAHWSQAGRSGEYAAGNGASMRIAPFAFFSRITRQDIRDACRITHRNEEAYVGALALVLCLQATLSGAWTGEENLFDLIIPALPDTSVRDRLIEINSSNLSEIKNVAQLGNNGYVVNSVPLAIFAASQVLKLGMPEMYRQLIAAGGDTDTNASMAGQIAGALLGGDNLPQSLISKLEMVKNYHWMYEIVENTRNRVGCLLKDCL